ncbi:unnamed protein product [Paramecium primaurelia]|uniref:Uncharacterized protein n=1 Tax=Paramecium primaurelia TaxID=5886 RepID=A0A8S1LSA7_PARPR|nr:unnamed protein product [Paramecium primaurelia]
MSKLEKFNFNIQNQVLKSPNDNQFKSSFSSQHSKLTPENFQFPKQKSYIVYGKFSNRILRIKKQNKLHKSQSQIDAVQFPNFINKIRRSSGCEILSDKQVRFAFLYPITNVAFHLLQKEIKRNEIRKKTIFKRMSSILIKHSNNLKSQTIIDPTQQETIDQSPSKFGEKQSSFIPKQFQKSFGCLKESQELFYNIKNSEKLQLYQDKFKRFSQSLTTSPKLNKNQKSKNKFLDSQKVVLDISRKQRKTFISIQNYVNERSLSNQTKSVGLIQKQIHFQYQNLLSLTETDSSSPIKLKTTYTSRNFNHIKSLSNLPDIREISTQRLNNNRIQKIAEKVKNVYILSPSKSKQIQDKIKI